MTATEVRPVNTLLQRRTFVDVPFRLHGHDPNWVPPLRLSVYDRISRRHPATAHQQLGPVDGPPGRQAGGEDRGVRRFLLQPALGRELGLGGLLRLDRNDPEVAGSLFDVALDWCRRQGVKSAVGPANFTTNDELGLLVEGFDTPAVLMTLENPPFYEGLWVGAGWQQVMDLYGYQFKRESTTLSERQRATLERLRERSKVTVRDMRPKEFDAEVGRFFDLYNAIWQNNWGYVPMPEAEVRHLAKQLKPVLNPHWAFALEREGQLVGVCLTVPDANQVMLKVRSGRLLPFGWVRLLGVKRVKQARVIALGVVPELQSLAIGPLLYHEIVDRLYNDGCPTAEASWTLATNGRINRQLEAMGARRYKVWRLYKQDV